MKRLSSCLVAAILCSAPFAFADLKITTRTTMQGHTTESTVYIKGARERREMSFGGRQSSTTITQCDQKRIVTVMGDQCMVMSMGGGETSCPTTPSMRDIARGMAGAETAPPRKGGVITISRTSTDTGERQDMFGYKARHIKSSMTMESSPDACNQSHMKMEVDGWYANLSADFSCHMDDYRSMACGGPGAKPGCQDRVVMKGGVGTGAELGYPLKQTTTMTSEQGTFTMSMEVVAISNTSLEPPLFEMPPGCRVMNLSAMSGGAAPAVHESPAPAAAPAPTPTAAPASPTPAPVAPKAAGAVRVGVVKIKDATGQGLPIDNLRLNLISELERNKLEVVPLDAEAPHHDVEAEARSKQCDYIVYTVPTAVKDANTGGLPPSSIPKGLTLDPAKYQAVTAVTLYKTGSTTPDFKDMPLAADASQFAVDAVMATFVAESDTVAHQIQEDAHPKPAAKKPAAKTAPKSGAAAAKPKQ